MSGVGQKAHRAQEGTGRENTTVLACCNAAGRVLPPLIIFQGANLWSTWKGDEDLSSTYYACSEKGWMTSAVFHEYFLKFCKDIRERPIRLIFDGHLTHLDVETAIYAKNNEVTIIKLPAHTTDVLQPLDKTCFKSLKYAWDQNILQWYRSNQRKMVKSEFVNILCKVWHAGFTSNNVIKGFKSIGIFPCDRNKYSVSRLDPEKLSKYNSMRQQTLSNSGNIFIEPRLETFMPTGLSEPSTSNQGQQFDDPVLSVSSHALECRPTSLSLQQDSKIEIGLPDEPLYIL